MSRFTARHAALTGGVAVLVAAFAAPPALATTTVSVGPSADLIGKVSAQVPVTATCGPLDPTLPFSFSASVTLTQARAKEIATGIASVGTGLTTSTPVSVVCDGTPQTFTVTVNANTSGPPFKNGQAVVQAFAFTFISPTFEQATTGPQTIRLR